LFTIFEKTDHVAVAEVIA
jgi:hypothetical protein